MIIYKTKYQNRYRINSSRLANYDYSQNGSYFITICTKDKKNFFGKIEKEKMIQTKIGQIATKFWNDIPKHFPFVELGCFILMPNHIHGIIIIAKDNVVETQNLASLQLINKFGPQSKNLASIIRGYKAAVKKYSTINKIEFSWQPRFYEHIIRNDESLNKIREYIIYNPLKWNIDRFNSN